jgi:hypothetical protein
VASAAAELAALCAAWRCSLPLHGAGEASLGVCGWPAGGMCSAPHQRRQQPQRPEAASGTAASSLGGSVCPSTLRHAAACELA